MFARFASIGLAIFCALWIGCVLSAEIPADTPVQPGAWVYFSLAKDEEPEVPESGAELVVIFEFSIEWGDSPFEAEDVTPSLGLDEQPTDPDHSGFQSVYSNAAGLFTALSNSRAESIYWFGIYNGGEMPITVLGGRYHFGIRYDLPDIYGEGPTAVEVAPTSTALFMAAVPEATELALSVSVRHVPGAFVDQRLLWQRNAFPTLVSSRTWDVISQVEGRDRPDGLTSGWDAWLMAGFQQSGTYYFALYNGDATQAYSLEFFAYATPIIELTTGQREEEQLEPRRYRVYTYTTPSGSRQELQFTLAYPQSLPQAPSVLLGVRQPPTEETSVSWTETLRVSTPEHGRLYVLRPARPSTTYVIAIEDEAAVGNEYPIAVTARTRDIGGNHGDGGDGGDGNSDDDDDDDGYTFAEELGIAMIVILGGLFLVLVIGFVYIAYSKQQRENAAAGPRGGSSGGASIFRKWTELGRRGSSARKSGFVRMDDGGASGLSASLVTERDEEL